MDKLLALRTFVATVRCGGFSAAARQLGLATSSVTRAVNALEQELGCVLLNRNTRQISVSEAGRDYFERALAIDPNSAEALLERGITGEALGLHQHVGIGLTHPSF